MSRDDRRTPRPRTLRHEATPAKRRLWRQLRLFELPSGHFRRQVPIGPYFADFAHHGLRMVVELDGGQHGQEAAYRYDEARTKYLESAGYRVLRFWNDEVRDNLDGVVETILAALPLPPRSGGEGRVAAQPRAGVGGATRPEMARQAGPAHPPPRSSASLRLGPPRRSAGGGRIVLSALVSDHLAAGEPTILVTVAEAEGSTPREAGAAMLVTLGGSRGTVGGGHLEFHAIDTARVMLARGEDERALDLPLGPLLGQCCGGRVRLLLRRAGPAEAARLARVEARAGAAEPDVLIYGAGHTGRALAWALAPLPLQVTVVDDRLKPIELPAGLPLLQLDDPAEAVARARAGAAHVILTHSHALDYRLAEAALRRGDAAYVGMIGSTTKRALFERSFRAGGGLPEALAALVCPIGGAAVRDKRPAVIAALVAAELLAAFARHGSCEAIGPLAEPAP